MRWLVGALAVLCAGCNPSLDMLENGAARPAIEIPPIEMEHVLFEGYHGELRDLSVTAASATVDMKSHVASLRDVSMGFAAEDAGKVEISAPVGEFQLDTDDFKLSNGVHGETAEGERFTTDAVRYVASRRVIVSDTAVDLRRSNLTLTATGMELEVATHNLRLTGNVKARVQPR